MIRILLRSYAGRADPARIRNHGVRSRAEQKPAAAVELAAGVKIEFAERLTAGTTSRVVDRADNPILGVVPHFANIRDARDDVSERIEPTGRLAYR